MSTTVFDLNAVVSADVSPFTRAMGNSASFVDKSFHAIASSAHANIGQSVVQNLIKATEAANEFGQTMADISAISDLNVKKLAKSIASMENVYGKMSSIGNTIYEAISSGIKGAEADYVSFTKTVGQAAKSIRADIEATGSIMTTLMNAYDLQIADASKIADMLFVTVREGKAQGNELARTLGLVTNTAAEAGIQFSELSAAISILSRTQSASQAMIGLNQMLNGLINPTIEARREAERWGIEVGATALQTKGFTAVLTELHDKVGGNVEAINKILGNIRAMRAGVALTGKQFDNFIDVLNKGNAEIGSGVAMEAFAKQTDTARQAVENLKVQYDKTLITIGKDLEPIFTPTIQIIENFLKNIASMSPFSKWAISLGTVSGVIKTIYDLCNTVKDTIDGLNKSIANLNNSTANKAGLLGFNHTARQKASLLASGIQQRIENATMPSPSAQIKQAIKGAYDKKSILEQAKANIGDRYSTVKVDAFSNALQKAANVLKDFSTSVGDAKTFVNAAFSPEKEKATAKQFYDARRNIKARAAANIDKMYSRNAKGALVDPVSGKIVSEQMALWREEQRLKAELAKQIKAYKDALKAEAEQQKKATQQEKQYQAELQREMQRVASARKREADRIQRELIEYEKRATLVARSSTEWAKHAPITAARRVSGSGAVNAHGVNILTERDKAQARHLRALRRSYMSEEDKARLTERFNHRMGKQYTSYAQMVSRVHIDWKGSFNNILGNGGVLSKIFNGFNAFNMVLGAVTTGWEIGKSIGEKFKFADSALIKWLDGIKQWFTGDKGVTALEASSRAEAQDALTLKQSVAINNKLIDRLVGLGKLTHAEALEYRKLNTLNATYDSLCEMYAKLIKQLDKTTKSSGEAETAEQRYIRKRAELRKQKDAGTLVADTETQAEMLKKIQKVTGATNLSTKILDAAAKGDSSPIAKALKGLTATPELLADEGTMQYLRELAVMAIQKNPSIVRDFLATIQPDIGFWRTATTTWHESNTNLHNEIIEWLQSGKLNKTAIAILQREASNIGAVSAADKYLSSKHKNEQDAIYRKSTRDLDLEYIEQEGNDIAASGYKRMNTFDVKSSKANAKRGRNFARGVNTSALADFASIQEEALPEAIESVVNAKKTMEELMSKRFKLSNKIESGGYSNLKVAKNALLKIDNAITTYYNHIVNTESTLSDFIESLLDKRQKSLNDTMTRLNADTASDANARYEGVKKLLNSEIKTAQTMMNNALSDGKSKGLNAGQLDNIKVHYLKYIEKLQESMDSNTIKLIDTYEQNITKDSEKLRHAEALKDIKNKTKERTEVQKLEDAAATTTDKITHIKKAANALANVYNSLDAKRDRKARISINEKHTKYAQQLELLQAESNSLRIQMRQSRERIAQQANTALLKTVAGYAGKRDKQGNLTNDALYHSLNLVSRVQQTKMMRTMMRGVYVPNSINYNKAMAARSQAQSAVSASIDSYLMSQKYAEANVGKTVVDIYKYMTANNTIMVRK